MRRTYLPSESNQAGFTLVELMVVVAIIGILSAIAIPNYQKFQAKARQTEARVGLSSAFTAQKSFSIEQNSFTSCLTGIGIATDNGKRFYSIGWNANGVANTCGPNGGLTCEALSWPVNDSGVAANPPATQQCTAAGQGTPVLATNKIASAGVPSAATNLLDPVITTSTFTISAAGQISSTATTMDTWSIDQNKNLVNTAPSL